MAILRTLWVVLPLSGLVVAACSGSSKVEGSGGTGASGGTGGGSSGAGGGAGTDGIPIGQAPVAIADAVCERAFACCSAEELMALSIVGDTEDQCRAAVAAFIGIYQVNIQASIAAMRAGYDGMALADCVAEHEARACDDLPSFEEIGCAGAVVPLIEMGETCGAHHECIDGYCEGAGSSASSPTGSCAGRKADGEPCADSFECEGGACSTATGCGPTTAAPLCGG